MKKKILACLLVAAMALALTACGSSDSAAEDTSGVTVSNETEDVEIDGITYHKATDLTEDEITLTYYHFDDEATVDILARAFEKLYPNITVNDQFVTVGDYQTTVLTLIQNGEAPDVMMYSDADYVLANMMLADITSMWESDDEVKELASTVEGAKLGQFETGHQFANPFKFFPSAVYADRNVFKKLGIDMPDNTWTWDEMIQIIKDATTTLPGDDMKYYGLGFYNRLDSYYGIAASQDIVGEFGFNGTEFNLGVWAIGEQEFADLKLGGYVAPSQSTAEMEAWTGDWDGWCGSTGHTALFSEAFWTFQNLWNNAWTVTDEDTGEEYETNWSETYGTDIVPLVIPAVSEDDASADHHSIATIDFGGLVNGTQHPREAYELMKFMSWGRNGWLTRIAAYADPDNTNTSGESLKVSAMPAPLTTNEEVWDAYIDMFCEGMDDEHLGLWEDYFETCMQPIPYGWENIAGYYTYCVDYFNNIDIHTQVDSGNEQASTYVDDAQMRANWYHAYYMNEYFGPNGYNVLSDDDIALYEQMVADNQ